MLSSAYEFRFVGAPVSCERYGEGHINETYLLKTGADRAYILQKINTHVFKNVDGLMANISAVTRYLSERDFDPRHTLRLIPTLDGDTYYRDEQGGCWRAYDFITDSLCLQRSETVEDFYQSAVAFGTFQRQLAEFPAAMLVETIPHFHDTAARVEQLREAIRNDAAGRAAEVQPEIAFYLARAEEAGAMVQLLAEGKLPLRVTHNDTKLNNVMLDAATRTPLCIIDLDTVMPGLAANDFGDSIRFGASTAAEDEQDLDKVEMSLALFEAYCKGFLGACGESLTELEIETLPLGAKLMTYECGSRFLADYLNNDVYFHTNYARQNLDRARTQMKLVADMEAKWGRMTEIVRQVSGR